MQTYLTTSKVSPRRRMTKEGFLICFDVPLARTGMQEYHPLELPIVQPKVGEPMIKVHRHPEEVFAPRTLASFSGKPLVDEHPEDDVTPDTWRLLAMGTIMDPRRGDGPDSDVIVGTVMVYDRDAIEMILADDKIEVSVGYDADYEQIAPGEAVQKNIIVNHVALVSQGRCGHRCSIGDAKPHDADCNCKECDDMSTLDKLRALMAKHKVADAESAAKEAEELVKGGANESHIHIHAGGEDKKASKDEKDPDEDEEEEKMKKKEMEDRKALDASVIDAVDRLTKGLDKVFKKLGMTGDAKEDEDEDDKDKKESKDAKKSKDDETIEGALEMESPPGTGDKARKAKDSMYLEDSYQELVSQIEVLLPGAKLPTFTRDARPAKTYDAMCTMRREALETAFKMDPGASKTMMELNGGRMPTFATMDCQSARLMLSMVVRDKAAANNVGGGSRTQQANDLAFGRKQAQEGAGGGMGVRGKVTTPGDLNKIAKEMKKNNAWAH